MNTFSITLLFFAERINATYASNLGTQINFPLKFNPIQGVAPTELKMFKAILLQRYCSYGAKT